jgi:hypothetical protein
MGVKMGVLLCEEGVRDKEKDMRIKEKWGYLFGGAWL